LQLAFEIARECPDITFYAYTKRVGMVKNSQAPDNFVFNFSKDATHAEVQQIDWEHDKVSITVPKALWADLTHREAVGVAKIRKDTGQVERVMKMKVNSKEALRELKKRLAEKYKRSVDSFLSYDEMVATPIGPTGTYNVIVMPGEGDASAARKDVQGTFLLIH
jgi:uncharacterized protein YlxP (DUF503 family)